MSTVCRCCLIEGPSMKNLFSFRIKCKTGETEDLSLADAYNLSTNLKLIQETKLPNNICLNCEEKLIAAYKFRIQCQTANTMLNLRCSEVNVDVKIEDNFWDAEFLYNVPSLFKGDFFGEELHLTDDLKCTIEVNPLEFDEASEVSSSEDDEVFEEKIILDSIPKRTCFKCTGCRRSFCK